MLLVREMQKVVLSRVGIKSGEYGEMREVALQRLRSLNYTVNSGATPWEDLRKLRGLDICDVLSFDYSRLYRIGTQERGRKNRGRVQKGIRYKDVICAFDIETSRIPGTDHSVMYIWQFCLFPTILNIFKGLRNIKSIIKSFCCI